MTRFENLGFFRAARRVAARLKPSQHAARLFSDWMEDADPEFDWTPEQDRRARTASQQEWSDLTARIDRRIERLAGARPDRRHRSAMLLADQIGLNRTERAIFSVALRAQGRRPLDGLCDLLIDDARLPRDEVVALVAGCRPGEVRQALSAGSRLFTSGLLAWPDLRDGRSLDLDVTRRLGRIVEKGHLDPEAMLAELFPAAPAPVTEWDDFEHLGAARDLALRLIRGALEHREPGVNILLYGPPGTGKTEFCKMLAHSAGRSLYAVGEKDEDDPKLEGRMSELRLAQRLLSRREPSLLLFDEMEDLLESDVFGLLFGRRTASSKVQLHRILETNTLPVLWTVNHIDDCDPALLRRMTLALEIRTPGPKIRERVWNRLAERDGLPLPPEMTRRLAEEIETPPALVSGALRVARLSGGGTRDLTLAVRAADKALRGGRARPPAPVSDVVFDPDLLCTDLDVCRLVERLSAPDAPRAVSFCFSGPPGTGKSALARHLARAIGLPVIQKRASDLLSMWVGGSERAIAGAFEQAREEEAFLIFDEADSLLADRRGAGRSWEVSQANEMLTWMESHPLPFACTTNLADRLDPAVRRRCTVHAELRALEGRALAAAFRGFFGLKPPPALAEIEGITPGDLAAVKRRVSVLGMTSADEIAGELVTEAEAKGGLALRPGFGKSAA